MSIEQVIQFMETTAKDEALQQQLQIIMGTGDGDISSVNELDASEAAVLKGQRGALVVYVAAKHGFEFSVDELMKVVDVFEKHQSDEISQEEFTNFLISANLHQDTTDDWFSAEKTIELVFRGKRYRKKVGAKNQPTTTITPIKPGDRLSSGSIAQVIEFMEKTAEDTALQKELQIVMGVGDGNISNVKEIDASEAKALKGEYATPVVHLAKEHGFNFSVDELINVIDVFEKHQLGEMSEEKFVEFISSADLNQYLKEHLPSAEKSVNLIFQGRRYRKTVTVKTSPSSPMNPTAQVVQFMEKTADDRFLQEELQNILGVGDGDISSIDELDAQEAETLKSHKSYLVVDLAAQHHFKFSVQDLISVINIFEKQKLGEISAREFSELTGISDLKKETSVELVFLGRRYRKTIMPNGEVKIEYLDNKPMRAEKSTSVIEFMLKTAEYSALQQEVKIVLGVGDGDISSIAELDAEEAKALKDKGSGISQIAAKYGFKFSIEDLVMVVQAFEQRQRGKISQKEFAQKTGLSELEKQSGKGLSFLEKTARFFSNKK